MDKDPRAENMNPILRIIAVAARSCRQEILESKDMSPYEAAKYVEKKILAAVDDIAQFIDRPAGNVVAFRPRGI
jgi:hypothetical protein